MGNKHDDNIKEKHEDIKALQDECIDIKDKITEGKESFNDVSADINKMIENIVSYSNEIMKEE